LWYKMADIVSRTSEAELAPLVQVYKIKTKTELVKTIQRGALGPSPYLLEFLANALRTHVAVWHVENAAHEPNVIRPKFKPEQSKQYLHLVFLGC